MAQANEDRQGKRKGNEGIRRLLQIAGQKRGWLTASATLAVISEIFGLIPFVVIYWVAVDLLSPPIDEPYVWGLATLAVAALVLRGIAMYVSSMLSHISAFNILYGLRTNLAKHLGMLPMGYFTDRSTGSIKKVLGEDVERIELFIAHHIPDLVSAIALPVLIAAVLFFVDWRLALAAIAPIPLAFIALHKATSGPVLEKEMRVYHDALERMHSTIVEYVRGMPVIKVFNQTVFSFKRFKESVDDYRDCTTGWSKRFNWSWTRFNVLLGSSLVFIVPVGIWLYSMGQVTMPVLILFLILGVGIVRPIYKIVFIFSNLVLIKEGVRRIDAVLQEPPLAEPDEPKAPQDCSVEFRDVSFSYGEGEALRDVSFVATKGTVTALVGPSGAGKTTVAQLIPRLWDVQKGQILIGGVDVRDIPTNELMDKVSFVFQDAFIFSDTVLENIRMGKEGVTEADVIEAAKAAQVHDVIASMPQGYRTVIGEGGLHLSGGEKQRISIARAILKDAPIILLDEATAFADPENECRIQNALSTLIRNKTAIVIAHRLSTVVDSDQILVMDGGEIVGRGKHRELLGSQELYRRMWNAHIAARSWNI
jgi:ATP-binding cassette subfamily B protein IrtA